jgi:hypothetical protein
MYLHPPGRFDELSNCAHIGVTKFGVIAVHFSALVGVAVIIKNKSLARFCIVFVILV